MRNWHHSLIKLDQALLLIAPIPQTSLAQVVIGIADGGMIQFESLTNPLEGLSYKASNAGLFKVVTSQTGPRQKSSLINFQGLNVTPELNTSTNFKNTTDTHAIRVAGIVLGNKVDQLNNSFPIQGIIEDAELISFGNRSSYYVISSVNNWDYYEKNGAILYPASNQTFKGVLFNSNDYIPDRKQANVINSSITFGLDTASQDTLKAIVDALKSYGNSGRGTVMIASAGNDGATSNPLTQAIQGFSLNSYPIIVSASTINAANVEISAPYSSYGDRVDLCAPSNNESIRIGIYTTTKLYCGEIGTDDEVVIKIISNQSSVNSLILTEVDFLFPGNCVELGDPTTNLHEVLVIKEVNRTTRKITFSQNRIKTAPPSTIPTSVRVPIIRTSASIETANRNRLRVVNVIGFGYQGQEVCIYDPSVVIPNPNPTGLSNYFYTDISAVLGTNLFELTNGLPIHMSLSGLVAVPGQMRMQASSYSFDSTNNKTTFYFSTAQNPFFDAFFVGCKVEVFDASTNDVLNIREIGEINKVTKSIVLDKYNTSNALAAGATLGLRSIGYGSYTSSFGGTSAAGPVVAGVAGLLLKVNNKLNALEVKHILKSTTDKITGASNYTLESNSSKYNYGYNVNNFFGSGRVNAEAAVQLAIDWHTNSAVLKPVLRFFDNTAGTIVPNNQVLDSPDVWIKPITESSLPLPATGQPFNTIDTTIDQKIFVRVRNTGTRENFKDGYVRFFVAFTDEANPPFPFPSKWYHKIDVANSDPTINQTLHNNVKLIGIKEIPLIAANSDVILDFEWKSLQEKWNEWNPLNKKAYILVHIAPFDGEDADISLTNIRGNKNLTCRPVNVTHFNAYKIAADGTKISLPKDIYNLAVNPLVESSNFKFEISNILDSRLDALKFIFVRKDVLTNVIEQTVIYRKSAGSWAFDVSPTDDWVKVEPTIAITDSTISTPNYKNAVLTILLANDANKQITFDITN
ncbi:S8 family serine peptidase [Flavobacterium sp. UBA7682]|uniref:S8 family serine peptidase n=1 Tax=Flavobacterium sp. UBA7682 TaxID=1946560 RepID=UPI0025C40422|nr:S8 family serine peptidase [Flavobacterium sp. UBA7682]